MADAAGSRFVSLLSLMARLRGDGGCPWDREQTRASLKPYLLEEAYEVLDAIDEGSRYDLVEELGDLLFQVVFHCQLGEEAGEFTMDDVIRQLCVKMTRRHPHVFGDRVVTDAREARAQWEQIKHEEAAGKDRPGSTLDGVPGGATGAAPGSAPADEGLPGRLRLDALAGCLGQGPRRDGRGRRGARGGDDDRVADELGDLLFSMVNVARLRGMDAEECLRRSSEKFTRRFGKVEAEMRAGGRSVTEASTEDLDRAWEAVKAQEGADLPRTGPRP